MKRLFLDKDPNRVIRLGIAAFLLPILLVFIAYSAVGIHPFGELNVLLVDAKLQYVAFFSELVRQLRAVELPFFSPFFGMGMNFYGTWAYYLSSPFNLLLPLFPDGAILDGIYLVLLAKIGACGLTFYLFAHKTLRATPMIALIFSLCYALSGFVVNYADNMQWLDAVFWLPVLILCVENLLGKGRSPIYPFVVAILVIANFHQAIMTGVFVVLYVFYAVLRDVRERSRDEILRRLFLVLWNSILGIGMSAIVLLPCYLLLRNQMGLIGQEQPLALFAGNPIESLRGLFLWSSNLQDNAAPAKIYSGLLAIAVVPVFLFRREISKREKILGCGFLLLIALSFHMPFLSFVWHGFDEPNAYPFRYSFCFSFALLMMAVKAIGGPAPILRRPRRVVGVYLAVLTAVLLAAFYAQGIMMMIAFSLFSLIFVVVYLYLTFAKNEKKDLLLVLVCVELVCNTLLITYGHEQVYHYGKYEDFNANSAAIRTALATDDTDSKSGRVALATRVISGNDPLLFGYSGIDSFSSLGNVYAQNAAFLLGYKYYINGLFEISDDTGSLLLHSLFGVTRIVQEADPLGSKGLSAVPTLDLDSPARMSGVTVLENPASLSFAYLVDEDILAYCPDSSGSDPLETCDAMLSAMLGEETITIADVVYTRSLAKMQADVTGPYDTFRPDGQETGDLVLDFVGQGDDTPIYFSVDYRDTVLEEKTSSIAATLSIDGVGDVRLRMPEPYATPSAMCLGAYPEGTEIRLTLHVKGTELVVRQMNVASQCTSDVMEALAPLKENEAEFSWIDNRSADIHLTARESGILFLSIPYDKGWEFTRNGEPVRPVRVAGAFMGIPVAAGANDIEMRFLPDGWIAGASVTAVCLLLAVVQNTVVLARRRSSFRARNLKETES